MADTKTGRERTGRNKTAQHESTLGRRDRWTLTDYGSPPALDRIDDEPLTDPRDLE